MTRLPSPATTVAALAIALCAALPSTAFAQGATAGSTPARVRATITAAYADHLDVTDRAGNKATVSLPPDATVSEVATVAPNAIQAGSYIGTAAVKQPDGTLRALEVHVFPESMRGAGEGHYEWDVPGVVASRGGGSVVSSAMTNGTVQSQSAMTNGTVSGNEASSGGRMLTITYAGGSANVTIPEGTPVVRFEPTERASLAVGQKVYAVNPKGTTSAGFLAMGKDGVIPPM